MHPAFSDPDRYLDLPEGWDSYNAKKPSQKALEAAKNFWEGVSVVPRANGGIQLERHAYGGSIEIQFHPDGFVEEVWGEPRVD